MELNLMHILWDSGPVVKIVLLLLISASVYSWAIILNRRATYKKFDAANKEFLEIYKNSENLKEVMEKGKGLPNSPYKIIFEHGHTELNKIKKFSAQKESSSIKEHFQQFGLGMLERALNKGMVESNKELEKHISSLASIGSVTPFVGLFGTVWGIMDSFRGLAGGSASIDAVAPGIAEALIATAVGLAAAIPAVWFYNYFSTQMAKYKDDLQAFSEEFVSVVERSLL